MANRLRKVPVGRTIPAVPGSPGTPAFCTDVPVYSDFGAYSRTLRLQEKLTESLFRSSIGSAYYGQIGTGVDGGPVYGIKTVGIPPDLSAMFSGTTSSGVYVWYYLRTCYPEIKPVRAQPARVEYESVPGWNGGGRSFGNFAENGYAQFYIGKANIASFVGISTAADTLPPGDCSHAFYGYQGNLQIFEDGVSKFTVVGGLADDPLLRITRTAGVVRYFVGDELVYTSLKPSVGYAYLDAALYAIGDFVDSPLIGAVNAIKATASVGVTAYIDNRMRAEAEIGVTATARVRSGSTYYLTAEGAVGLDATALVAAEVPMAATAVVGITATASFAQNTARLVAPVLQAIGAESSYSQAALVSGSSYTVDAYGGFPTVEFAYGAVEAPPVFTIGYMTSGGIGTAELQVPKGMVIGAETSYAQAALVYSGAPTIFAYEPWLSPDAIEIDEVILVGSEFELYADVPLSFFSVVEVSDGLFVELEISEGLEWFDSLMVTDSMAELSDQSAEWSDSVYVTDQSSDYRNAVTQLAVNVASAAPVEYTNFNFLKIIHTASGSYGLREDGIYRIGGVSDNGALRTAYVDLGNPDLGSVSQKHVDSIFFGLSTDGEVLAMLRDDSDIERMYRVIERRGYLRADAARGVISKYWRLRLEIIDATQADLSSIEFVVSTTGKTRWTR